MDIPSCQIPPIALGLITEERQIVADDNVRGVQMLALVCALKSANDALAKAAA